MTKPETLPALIARIERVRDWADQEQSAAAARLAAAPGNEPMGELATFRVSLPYEAIERAMRIILGEEEPNLAFHGTPRP